MSTDIYEYFLGIDFGGNYYKLSGFSLNDKNIIPSVIDNAYGNKKSEYIIIF